MKRIFLLAVLLSLPFAAFAAPTHVSSQDKTWLMAAHQVNLEEIQSGALAREKGASSTVRDLGHALESDHRNLDAKLVPVAGQLGVQLPGEPTSKAQAQMRRLKRESGMAFDAEYVKDEINGHQQAIAKTNKEIAKGSSMQVKQLARETLPVLEKHLKMLQQAPKEMHHG